jgi:hypothetical protein
MGIIGTLSKKVISSWYNVTIAGIAIESFVFDT